jgi:hypothetical protein
MDAPCPSVCSQDQSQRDDQSFTPFGSPQLRSCSHLTGSSVADTHIFCPFCAQVGPRHSDVTSNPSRQGSGAGFDAQSAQSFTSSFVPPPDVPEMFLCPISNKILVDPVVAGDGFTYDRHSITQWFDNGHNDSPVTRKELRSRATLPNLWVKSAVTEWVNWRKSLTDV